MSIGLTLMGIVTLRSGSSHRPGALAPAMGAFGWIYALTDTGAVLEVRSVHTVFGLLSGLGWVPLGVLLKARSRRARRPRARS